MVQNNCVICGCPKKSTLHPLCRDCNPFLYKKGAYPHQKLRRKKTWLEKISNRYGWKLRTTAIRHIISLLSQSIQITFPPLRFLIVFMEDTVKLFKMILSIISDRWLSEILSCRTRRFLALSLRILMKEKK